MLENSSDVTTKTYSINEAKEKFSQVIASVIQGEEIIVTKMGKLAVTIFAYELINCSKRLDLMICLILIIPKKFIFLPITLINSATKILASTTKRIPLFLR